MAEAANRHYCCATSLNAQKEAAEACYLIGLAAECAVKSYLEQAGFNSKKKGLTKDDLRDPNYLHFPELAAVIVAQGNGIVPSRIINKMSQGDFLSGWTVKMRYKKQISDKTMINRFNKWKAQTDDLLGEIGL